MSERSVSTTAAPTPPFRVGVVGCLRVLAISLGATVVLMWLAVGPKGLAFFWRFVTDHPWAPHAPHLSLLARESLAVQLHLTAVLVALGVGVALMTGVKGTRLHRTLGWGWVAAMSIGAAASLFIREINHGGLSFLHIFAGWTFLVLPVAVVAARRHQVKRHARSMTGLFTGGLLVAGLFAFVPGRLMWRIFFG